MMQNVVGEQGNGVEGWQPQVRLEQRRAHAMRGLSAFSAIT